MNNGQKLEYYMICSWFTIFPLNIIMVFIAVDFGLSPYFFLLIFLQGYIVFKNIEQMKISFKKYRSLIFLQKYLKKRKDFENYFLGRGTVSMYNLRTKKWEDLGQAIDFTASFKKK